MVLPSNASKTRKKYTPEFKRKVAEEVSSSADSFYVLGKKYGITTRQVERWYSEYHDPESCWVNKLVNSCTEETTQTETSQDKAQPNAIAPKTQKNEMVDYSLKNQSYLTVELSLPNGTKMKILDVTPDLLNTLLNMQK